MAKIVNVKVAFIRPEYQNLKEWMKDSNNVYIGRRGIVFVDGERWPKNDSVWANPFKIGKDGNRDKVLKKYEVYIRKKLANNAELEEELNSLKTKSIGCWCYCSDDCFEKERKAFCHGDILVKLLEETSN